MQIIIWLTSLLISNGERIITSRLGNYFKGDEVQFFTSEIVGFNINTIGQLQKEILDFIVEKLNEEKIKDLLDQNAINKIHFANNYFQERGDPQLQKSTLTKILSKLKHIIINIIELHKEWGNDSNNDTNLSPSNRRKRDTNQRGIFAGLQRETIIEICVVSLRGSISDYLLESDRGEILSRFKKLFCKCVSGVLRISNVFKRRKWIKCIGCLTNTVINRYTLQILNRHTNDCLQKGFKGILANNQNEEWHMCRGIFGKGKEFWEADSEFYFSGECFKGDEEGTKNLIKKYLESGSWTNFETPTLLPALIDESYGDLDSTDPCIENLSNISHQGNLTWDELEGLRLESENKYYECSNVLARSTRSPNSQGEGGQLVQSGDNEVGVSTESPIKLSRLAILKEENNRLERKDSFIFEMILNSQIREFIGLSEKLEEFIFNLQNTFEKAKLEKEFFNTRDFKIATKRNINKVVFLNKTNILLLTKGRTFYKANTVKFCRLNLCLSLEKGHNWNIFIHEIDNITGDYKYCKKISYVHKFKTCNEIGLNPKCAFAKIRDKNCVFTRVGFVEKYRISYSELFDAKTNELIENIGEDTFTYSNTILFPTNEFSGNFKRIYKYHLNQEEIAYDTHLINILGMHLINTFILKSDYLTGTLVLSIVISMAWTSYFAAKLTIWVYKKIVKKLERAERRNLESLRREKMRMKKLRDTQKEMVIE